jgi:hypothetical protein
MAEDKGTTLPITQLSGLQINYKDSNSCLNPPIVTTIERNALINSNDPANKIKAGTIVYNSDDNAMQVFQGGAWVALEAGAGGDVSVNGATIVGNLAKFNTTDGKLIADSGIALAEVGTVKTSTIPKDGNLASFDGITGKLISDSGINVVPIAKISNEVNATPLYRLSNLAALQFGSNNNVADIGVILVDSLTPITFQTQGTGVDAQVCTVINGELGAGSSSPSALLEINNTTGGFLHSRLTTTQRDALVTPVDGTEIFNTTTKKLNIRSNGAWVELGAGGAGNVVGPLNSVENNIPTFDNTTGTLIKDSGIDIDSIKNVIFRKVKTIFGISGGGSFFLPNIDICKITFIGNGGNGGKAQNGYKGCGGGQGGKLVVYLKNLLSIPDFQIRYSSGFDNRGCYMEIDANNFDKQVIFKANMGDNGADGSSSVISGGAGGTWSVVQTGTIYTADNYSYYGIQGASGGVATNSGVSGYGGGGASGVVGNNPGLNGSSHVAQQDEFVTGGGGSGSSGDGLPGGTGSYGYIIIEY